MIKTSIKLLTAIFITGYLSGCTSSVAITTDKTPTLPEMEDVRVATWNVEHLAYPANLGCKPRTSKDLVALKDYVTELDADIVALQEVASEQAAGLIFPKEEWQIVMSARADSESYTCRESGRTSTQQKVAFAVRKGIEIVKTESFDALGLDAPGLRYGLVIDVNTDKGPMRLMSVHLKSGCFVDDYTKADSDACHKLSQQVPLLKRWIAEQQSANTPFVILGDFNHRLSAPYNRMTRELGLIQATPSQVNLATMPLISCHPRYPAPIDHIVYANLNAQVSNLQAHYFEDMSEEAMLSDHCAVSVTLK